MPLNRLLFLSLPSIVFMVSLSTLIGGDFTQFFHFLYDVFNSSDPFVRILFGAFSLAVLITLGITYIIYLSIRRQDRKIEKQGSDTSNTPSTNTEEINSLKQISHYYLYAFVGIGILWLLQQMTYSTIMDYTSLLIPITLIFMLFRNLNDQRHLLLGALVMACFDFLFYIGFNTFSLDFILLYTDPQFLKIDIFLFIEFLPLILLLLFFSIQASTSTFRWIYGLLMVPLIVGVFAPLFLDYYIFLAYSYITVFEIFTLVAYLETRNRITSLKPAKADENER